MSNKDIAAVFSRIALILEIKGENIFRIRAYQRAARTIESLPKDLSAYCAVGQLEELPGIGKDIAGKVRELVTSGKLDFHDSLVRSVPAGLLQMLQVPGIGPKTAKLLYEKLNIRSLKGLEKAARGSRLTSLFGIKEKTVQNILKGIAIVRSGSELMHLEKAGTLAQVFLDALREVPAVVATSAAGSLRRCKEIVRDIDILVASRKPQQVMERFTTLAGVKAVQERGETKSSVLTKENIQVDLRVVDPACFGAALVYFTGSKDFNVRLRQLGIKKGLKVSEYGVFKVSGRGERERFIAGKTEAEVFKALGMQYVEPELREDQGEIDCALQNKLPRLVTSGDIKGDFHVHSEYSDGTDSIETLVRAAVARGYEYVGCTDHSESLRIAAGLTARGIAKKRREIERLQKRFSRIHILLGSEVEIGADGSLDYPDKVLSGFDIVIAAIHSGFKQSKEQLTQRMIAACHNPYVNIIAHPFGKLWGVREAYELDFDAVLTACRSTNTSLEINSFPDRFDLDSMHIQRAKESGVRCAINTDSHSVDHLRFMDYGVCLARRGRLTAGDVLNTRSFNELQRVLKK